MSESTREAVLLKGNEACAEGAIAGGCRYFFGYPITPQNQIPEYMARHLPEVGGVYLQAESEVAAINMVIGAAAAGTIPMTSSSSPGISLMQEGLSYLVGCELPCVLVNMVRGGPGLGNIAPAQSDYWMSTRGLGHGDGRSLVFAPYSVQEIHDWTAEAFDIAARYRLPVTILGDAALAQVAEPCQVRLRGKTVALEHEWAVGGGLQGRERRIVNSLWVQPDVMEQVNLRIAERLKQASADLTLWQETGSAEPAILVCAYGVTARVAETAIEWAAERGVAARLFRPISLVPFPYAPLGEWAGRVRKILVLELSLGQMIEDVRLAAAGRCEVEFFGRAGGQLLYPEEVADRLVAMMATQG